jgi:ubiquinone biosynthesis protein
MNIFNFVKLIRMIYGKAVPDLKKIEDMGLLAVKIAQHYSLRVDFLDEAVCQELQKLFRSSQKSDAKNGRELLSRWVAEEWFLNFQTIDELPFASASIGQVHRAILQSGEEVVIKVIKRDFAKSFLKDIRALRRTVEILLIGLPHLKKVFDPLAVLKHIEEYTLQELDLLNEISGADELAQIQSEYITDFPLLGKLHFPTFYRELSTSNVLVSKKIEGITYDESLQEGTLQYEKLLNLFSIHGLFLFGAGRFHGDMHPGNVLVKGEDLYFVDTGALSSCTSVIRQGLFQFFVALVDNRLEESAGALRNMTIKPLDNSSFQKFKEKFLLLYSDFEGSSVAEVSLTKKMMDTIKLAVNSGMAFDQSMFPIIKSLMYLDGMVLCCNPDAVLLRDMKPIIGEFKTIIERRAV